MSVVNRISGPAAGASVFRPMPEVFGWAEYMFSVGAENGSAVLSILFGFITDVVEVGDKIRILNGDYAGVHGIIEIIPQAVGVKMVLDTPYIGNSSATGSDKFIPQTAEAFQIISGYSDGPESAVKPWGVSSEIRVAAGADGQYKFDISSYLRKEYTVSSPLKGPHPDISLRYIVQRITSSTLPDDAGALTAYYGLEALSPAQIAGDEALSVRPVLFFGGVPTLYSLTGAKGIVNNYLAEADSGPENVGGAVIELQLLSCEARELVWAHTGPTAGFTTNPALPDWIQATAVGDTIEIVINPCSAGVGDYLSADYSPLDYLTEGVVNSVTGCYSFDFELSGVLLFTLNVCIAAISEIVEVCKSDVLNFAWLNSRGGFSSFALECRAIEGRDFGGETNVVSSGRVLKRTEYRDVYDTVEVRAGVFSKNQLDFITDLRSSIQAFLFNPGSGEFDIPIVIDRERFRTYENRFNQSETRVNFRFKKAAQVRVQTQ